MTVVLRRILSIIRATQSAIRDSIDQRPRASRADRSQQHRHLMAGAALDALPVYREGQHITTAVSPLSTSTIVRNGPGCRARESGIDAVTVARLMRLDRSANQRRRREERRGGPRRFEQPQGMPLQQ